MRALRVMVMSLAIGVLGATAVRAAETERVVTDEIGRIVAPPKNARVTYPPSDVVEAQTRSPIDSHSGLTTTTDDGYADVLLSDEVVHAKRSLRLLGGSEVVFLRGPDNRALFYNLTKGRIFFVAPEQEVQPIWLTGDKQKTKIRSLSTSYIIDYNPATHTTEVIGVSGHAEVTSVVAGGLVTVGRGERATVVDGFRPEKRTPLSDAELVRYVRTFEMLGGGKPESQVADDPTLIGTGVLAPDRAPVGGGPRPPTDDVGERNPPVIDQPPSVIEGTDLGIQF